MILEACDTMSIFKDKDAIINLCTSRPTVLKDYSLLECECECD